jgi:hypothetical protein
LREYFAPRSVSKYQVYNGLFLQSMRNIKIADRPSLPDLIGILRGEVSNRIR